MRAANAALAMPYPGLRPFEDKDQPLFFGREAQVSDMLLQLEDHRFVAVVGSSGSGKSSLVRAGLLPAVREGFLLGTTDWLTIIIKPGHQPYQRLVRALSLATCRTESAQVVPAYDDPLAPDETATLAMLRRTDRGLLTALDQLAISPESRVMVVVDQFEELFAFRRAGVNRDTVASRDEAAAFVGMLIRSASDRAGRVWAILTMRSDFIGDCEAFLGLPEEISHSQFLVPRLDRGQMEEAIARPAAVEEGTFKTFTFEDGLVNRIINDAGDRPDQLPLMQHALMRTWKHAVARADTDGPVTVTPEDYEAAGGIEMALSLHADAAWDEIKDDPKKAHIARRLFLLLCDISPDGQITRRRPQVVEVQAVTGASLAEIEQVVRVFQQDDRNFLLPPPPLTAESYLDISHEALLRQWRLFAGEWQEQERRDASEIRRLAELASLRKQGEGGRVAAQDLERIDRWKQRVSAEWARRYVTKDAWKEAISFVEESRAEVKREEEQRQKQARYKRALLQVVAFILLGATGISVWLMKNANEAKAAAQQALTRSFVRTIGVSNEVDELPPDELAALWELAELAPANLPVRERVVDHWLGSEEYVRRALKRRVQGLHAAVGLNMALRNYSASKATEMADRLAKALEDPKMLEDPGLYASPLSNLGDTLAALAVWTEPKKVASLSSRGAQVLAKALEDPKMLEDPGLYASPLSNLGNALAALAAHMEPKEAASVSSRGAQVLAKALENPKMLEDLGLYAFRLLNLGNALAALAAHMEPKEAASVSSRGAQVLAKALGNPKFEIYQLSNLGNALEALAARMEPKDVASVAKALEDYDASRLPDLIDRLTASAAQMEPKEAASRLIKALEDLKTKPDQLSNLDNAQAALAARIEPKEAASRLAKALEDLKTKVDQLSNLDNALAALAAAARIEPKEAASRLAKALEDPKTKPDQLSNLGNGLAALAARIEPKEAASVSSRGAQVLAKALGNPKFEIYELSNLGNALAALAAHMEPKEAASVSSRGAQVLAKALENPKTDKSNLQPLCNALAALAAHMEPKGVAHLADGLAKALAPDHLPLLGWTLGPLSLRIPSARRTRCVALSIILAPATSKVGKLEPKTRKQLADLYALIEAQDLAEILKWPFCVGEAEKIALAELEKKTGRKFGGDVWKFVEQAPSLGIKNLDAPAKRPKVEDALKELKSVATGGEVPRSSGGK